ncbi:MAG: flagellar biosynthesis protein [Roseovarius sp.]|nr:flagellar biosynthesis protein [Roseovarius sp.]
MTDISLEEQKLEAFERGYQAGWDDSVKSQVEDSRRITADLSQNLQDLNFTYEEAYSAIMESLRPLLEQMIGAVLPRLSQETLAPRLIETLHDIAREHGRQKVEIAAAPGDVGLLEGLTEEISDLPIGLTEDTSLASGQVYLRFGEHEQQIDLQDVLQGIDRALSGFFEQNRKAIA